MPGFATLRLNSQPYMLSILRIVVGLLYMEHGLAKILDFPHQPNHVPYALFTLNPGLQGLLELVGGLLLALGLFTRTVAFVLAVGNRLLLRVPLFLGRRWWRMEPRSPTRAGILVRPVARPGLSRLGRRPPNAVDNFRGAAGAARSTLFERCQKLEKRPRSQAPRG
jgi:uncharacterized membrane protein YphA (DoxX/SURF4 family)